MKQKILKHCPIGLFTLICCTAFSQKNVKLQLPTSISRTALKAPSISAIDVVSYLSNTSIIGVIPSEVPNTRNNLVAPEGIQNWLREYVNKAYASTYSASGTKLVWDVNTLSAGTDSSKAGIFSYVKIAADILTPVGEDNYKQLGSFDTVMVSSNKSPDIGKNIATALNALYNNSVWLTSEKTKGKIKNVPASLKINTASSLITKAAFKVGKNRNWKILSDTVFHNGVFLTFEEFKNNAPSVTSFVVRVDSATKQVKLYQFASDSSTKLIPNAWGLAVKNELYRYQNGQLYPIEKSGSGFALSKYLNFRTRKNQGFYWRRNIGEKQGDKNPFDDSHIFRAPIAANSSVKIETTKVDSNTGELIF